MYTLRYPFGLPPGQEIAVTEESTSVGDLSFALKRQDRFYVLTISGLPSEEEGKRYINNVWAGLMWLLLTFLVFHSVKYFWCSSPVG